MLPSRDIYNHDYIYKYIPQTSMEKFGFDLFFPEKQKKQMIVLTKEEKQEQKDHLKKQQTQAITTMITSIFAMIVIGKIPLVRRMQRKWPRYIFNVALFFVPLQVAHKPYSRYQQLSAKPISYRALSNCIKNTLCSIKDISKMETQGHQTPMSELVMFDDLQLYINSKIGNSIKPFPIHINHNFYQNIMSKKSIGDKYEYEVNNRLGQGAFAEVYRGKNKVTGEIVAIKVIKRSILTRYGDDMLKQIHIEIQVLQQLVKQMRTKLCPFINKIFECLETTNHIYIVLEFCNEGTLLSQIQKMQKNKTTYEINDAIMILFQLTHALAFLADSGTAHRDIKPENIFIKDGICKLGDFGFAGQKQMYQTHLGTYPYMAPEFFNSKSYDGAVDVWALGCMFHEILFGEIYFIGSTQYEVSMKIMNKPYQIRADFVCTDEIKDLLPRMIEKDKTKRITAAQVLEHPLFNEIKVSPKFQKIMQEERKYMDKYFSGQDHVEGDMVQSNGNILDEVNSLAQLSDKFEVLDINKKLEVTPNIDIIIDGINSMRNGVYFFIQLCEFLQKQFINECRYEIFYILKQSFVQIGRLKELLDHQSILSESDNIELKGIDPEAWKYYYTNVDEKYLKQREDVTHDKAVILKSYIDYYNYINNHTQLNYSEHLLNLQAMTKFDLQEYISPQLLTPQIHSTITYFAELVPTIQDQQEKLKLQKLILWLYLAANSEQVFAGKLVDIGAFLTAQEQNNLQGMKTAITIKH